VSASKAEAPCDLLAACEHPASCPALSEPPPDVFSVKFETTAGQFTITTVTEWAPPYAERFWQLARTEYMQGAPFYRVDRISNTEAWVVQFGYRGEPTVDKCWDDKMTSNATWSVHKPGNVRGTVAFSMNAVVPTPEMINCTSELYCAQGFSTNIFINYANNTRLDSPGFSVFGYVEEGGMSVIDRLFAGYGEVSDLCGGDSTQKSAAGTSFCNGFGSDCKGVSMRRLLDEGRSYWKAERPLLDSILSMQLVPTERWQAEGWLSYDDGEKAGRREHRARRRAGKRDLLRLRSGMLPWNPGHGAEDDSPIEVTGQ
jgi:cyclophilin family peptidyl-prolyl cis-trans isomerase